jgi:hypothetical protein
MLIMYIMYKFKLMPHSCYEMTINHDNGTVAKKIYNELTHFSSKCIVTVVHFN